MFTREQIQEDFISKLPEFLFKTVNKNNPFLFLDFEVFAFDWMVCFSPDGVNIKSIVNDAQKLTELISTKFNDRIIIAYNGNSYDKFINLALMNGLNVKEVNDKLINTYNFNFNFAYSNQISIGKELTWYDPISRNDGSLKTYEACEGENIYESEVSFDLDRPLTDEEIEETKNYCSFDVKQLIKFFFKEKFDSFLGHIGLIEQTMKARPYYQLYSLLPKTDASLVGTYLCSGPGVDLTKPTDVIKLPTNINLGKYKEQIEDFLKIPITTLKKGSYNGLNSWSIKTINKAINACSDESEIIKIDDKINKQLEKIKKLKTKLQSLKEKTKLTDKQMLEMNDVIPKDINKGIEILQALRSEKELKLNDFEYLKDLKKQLDQYEFNLSDSNCNYFVRKILEKVEQDRINKENEKLKLLLHYLSMSNEEIYNKQFIEDKTQTAYNSIMIEYPFELVLNIKGIPHLFKTGGIHSVYDKSLCFDQNSEHDKNRKLIIADVGSLYPNLMRVFNLCSMGMDDPKQFAQMIFDRIELKKKKDPFANVLKLILNTTYGCMGSEYNNLYDPTNRLKVCIFGQSALVDLLDKLEDKISTLEIFQSNTDGIIISCLDSEYEECVEIMHDWERRTGLELEIEDCVYLMQKDVSNYILLKK